MVRFTTTILQFGKNGEKTGWTYILIPEKEAQSLKAGNKKSFRVKGKLDAYTFSKVALLPMGEGEFIMPLNAAVRKAIGKGKGAKLVVELSEDKSEVKLPEDLMICLADEPSALAFFESLARSHQLYFGKWIDSAKTEETRAKRIARTVNAMVKKMDYGAMIRAGRE
jgi:hypothetical protein